jgi:hypothetical protein
VVGHAAHGALPGPVVVYGLFVATLAAYPFEKIKRL